MISLAHLRRRVRHDHGPGAVPPRRPTSGVPARVAAVTVAWVALWGDAALPVWLAGAGVGVLTLVVLPPRRTLGARPVGVVRLAAEVTRQLAIATVGVVRVVLARSAEGTTHLVTVPVHLSDPRRLAMLCSLVTLTPGSTVVELRPDRAEIDLNVLAGRAEATVHADVARLAAAIRGAVGPSPLPGRAT